MDRIGCSLHDIHGTNKAIIPKSFWDTLLYHGAKPYLLELTNCDLGTVLFRSLRLRYPQSISSFFTVLTNVVFHCVCSFDPSLYKGVGIPKS